MKTQRDPQNITWQKPEIWTIDGHKCHMYQSANQWLNWRVLKIETPNGETINSADIPYKTNISPNRARAEAWLERKIKWHNMSDEEKDAWIEANSLPGDLLF